MKIRKRTAFLAIAVLTMGMGLLIGPGAAMAVQDHDDWYSEYDAYKESSPPGTMVDKGGEVSSAQYSNSSEDTYSNGLASESNAVSVPEPSTLFLIGSGMVGLAMYGRKFLRK